jgi:hypothetical protein
VSEEVTMEERKTKLELCELFEREEIMAKQQFRWLKEGNMNTSFFHARASARRKTNKIDMLLCADAQSVMCRVS